MRIPSPPKIMENLLQMLAFPQIRETINIPVVSPNMFGEEIVVMMVGSGPTLGSF
jgi:hypothetical protein